MSLDVGTKRIGIALSDFLLITAQGYSYISREPENKALESMYKIAKENHVEKIVVGLPMNMDGTKGFQAENCEVFASKIKGYEIYFKNKGYFFLER